MKEASTAVSDQSSTASTIPGTTITFLIRPFSWFMAHLHKSTITAPNHVTDLKLFIEGPYDHSPPLHNFGAVILVSAGSGIAGVLPFMLEHTRTPGRTRDIWLLWTAKQSALVADVLGSESAGIGARSDVHLTIHVTGKDGGKDLGRLHGAGSVTYERPDVAAYVRGILASQHEAGTDRAAILV
jgi:hypothetical protein